ncbi:MAG: aldolase/citrate lyase family protein [Gemmatimonadetes bacterium]|nr:aldolase/citrate lyase family protein [Gemmatimonadota bacterium]
MARTRWIVLITILGIPAGALLAQQRVRLNPMIDLLERKQPVFGLYAPSNRRPARGAAGADTTPQKTPPALAREAVAYAHTDFIFDGGMEGDFERGYPGFAAFAQGMADAGGLRRSPAPRLTHPLAVKMHRIAPDPAKAAANIARQLDLGVSAIVFVHVESAEEVRAGIAAMRFRSNGGTRPDEVGVAPERWGMSAAEYRRAADVWPLNPDGELVNWTIVESREGLARVREIAAVDGIGVLFPGAGTLRGVFTRTDANGQRVFDAEGWEAAIQQVLAACKEFDVACGYPATENDIEMRMQQGFSVFIMNWGEPGFRAIELGRRAGGR